MRHLRSLQDNFMYFSKSWEHFVKRVFLSLLAPLFASVCGYELEARTSPMFTNARTSRGLSVKPNCADY